MLCACSQQLSQMEPHKGGNRDPIVVTVETILPQKNSGIYAPESSPVNSCIPELLHLWTTWSWVVDMMMWLAWWCGWHDGAISNHDSRPQLVNFLTIYSFWSIYTYLHLRRFIVCFLSLKVWICFLITGVLLATSEKHFAGKCFGCISFSYSLTCSYGMLGL